MKGTKYQLPLYPMMSTDMCENKHLAVAYTKLLGLCMSRDLLMTGLYLSMSFLFLSYCSAPRNARQSTEPLAQTYTSAGSLGIGMYSRPDPDMVRCPLSWLLVLTERWLLSHDSHLSYIILLTNTTHDGAFGEIPFFSSSSLVRVEAFVQIVICKTEMKDCKT